MHRVLFKSESVEWATPKAVYENLDREFAFNLDPCPLGGTIDGLSPLFVSWAGKRVWCNPPYDNIRPFLERAAEADLAVFLIPARVDTRWFHDLVLPKAQEIRFLRGRLKFIAADSNWKSGGHHAPFPSMVVVFNRFFSEGAR